MQLVPSPKTIILKRIDKPTETPGGLILPENASPEGNSDKIGEVIEVGSEVKLVKIGDRVAFNHYNASVVNFGRETGTLVFVVEENILAVIK